MFASNQRPKPAKRPTPRSIGPRNLARLESNLRRHDRASGWLRDRGLRDETVRRFHLGMKEPYRRRDGALVADVLAYPLLDQRGVALRRYGYLNVPGVTQNGAHESGWSPGAAATYWVHGGGGTGMLLVFSNVVDAWVAAQAGLPATAAISSTQSARLPSEWGRRDFWQSWDRVVVFDRSGHAIADQISPHRPVGLFVISPDALAELAEGCMDCLSLAHWIAEAQPWSPPISVDDPELSHDGDFAIEPVDVNGAFVAGQMYYPFTVERRAYEPVRPGATATHLVQSYEPLVVRSDGCLLRFVSLPAPRGTPCQRQVKALSDGTRITNAPASNPFATWGFPSIQSYIRAVRSGASPLSRPIGQLMDEVEACLRRRVWLPDDDHYACCVLYVAMSHLYQVFSAVPLVLIHGERGTGKSELAHAMADLAFNSVIIGQTSAASLIRLVNEARGLVVLDDLEALAATMRATFGDLSQALKVSYKRTTARKPITQRNGRVAMFDFFGPKVVTNTRGVDAILQSRMLPIGTKRAADLSVHPGNGRAILESAPELRDELHCWAMYSARSVHDAYKDTIRHFCDREGEILAPLRAIAAAIGRIDLYERTLRGARSHRAPAG